MYCIDHSVNVMIEKPMAMNIEDADTIIVLAKEKKEKSDVFPIGLYLKNENILWTYCWRIN